MKKHLINLLLASTVLLTSCNFSKKDNDTTVTSCKDATEVTSLQDEITQKALEQWRSEHFGMFIHFGIYSELAGWWKGEKIPFYGEQIMNHARITTDEYEAVAKTFLSCGSTRSATHRR